MFVFKPLASYIESCVNLEKMTAMGLVHKEHSTI